MELSHHILQSLTRIPLQMELRHHPLQSLTRISSRKECDALHSLEGQQQGQDPSRWQGGGWR